MQEIVLSRFDWINLAVSEVWLIFKCIISVPLNNDRLIQRCWGDTKFSNDQQTVEAF